MLASFMNNDDDVELWRSVEGWIGYEISNYGRMRSTLGGRSKEGPVMLTIQGPPAGYRFVNLYDHGRRKRIGVHQLVANAFCEPRQSHHTGVRHLDGDPSNNFWKNLKWGTQKENHDDTVRHGRLIHGERSTVAKITDEDAKEIFLSRDRNCRLAARFGLSQMAVVAIRRGLRWKHVNGGQESPTARIFAAGAAPSKLTDEQAREIFLSPRSNRRIARDYGVSESFVSHIRARRKWASATEGLAPPVYEVEDSQYGVMSVSPLKTLSEEIIREIYLSPLSGAEMARKAGCTESHVSQIRSGVVCGHVTVGLTAPSREKQNHKITAETARKIFLDPRGLSQIAAAYRLTKTMASYIKRRKAWADATKDLPDVVPGLG